METIERIIVDKDWISLLLLGVVFLIVLLNIINQKRLQKLLFLPFNDSYRLNYSQQTWHIFNILFFVVSNLILSLFVYVVILHFSPARIVNTANPYFRILSLVLIYWIFRYGLGKLMAFLFEIKKTQNKVAFMKMSYLFSSSLYLLLFLIIIIYYSNFKAFLINITIAFYAVLLLVRYVRFINIYKRLISTHLFYFILYLCALEIAPLFIAIKIGLQ